MGILGLSEMLYLKFQQLISALFKQANMHNIAYAFAVSEFIIKP